LRRLVEPLADEYDLVVLDCPPSVSLVSESVVHAADLLLVPLIPATMATRSLDQLVEFLDALGAGGHDGAAVRRPEVLAFLSMVDRRKRLHRELAETLPKELDTISEVVIPALSVVERMADERSPVTVFAPRSPATAAYTRLWTEVACRLGLLEAR